MAGIVSNEWNFVADKPRAYTGLLHNSPGEDLRDRAELFLVFVVLIALSLGVAFLVRPELAVVQVSPYGDAPGSCRWILASPVQNGAMLCAPVP